MFNRGFSGLLGAVAVAQGLVMAAPAVACEEPLNGIAHLVLVDDAGAQIATLSNVILLQGAPAKTQTVTSVPSENAIDPYADYSRAGTMKWVPQHELINELGGS